MERRDKTSPLLHRVRARSKTAMRALRRSPVPASRSILPGGMTSAFQPEVLSSFRRVDSVPRLTEREMVVPSRLPGWEKPNCSLARR